MGMSEDTSQSEVKLDNEFFTDLMKDTSFVMADNGSLMSSRPKVPTPIYVLNCLFGGGLPLGNIGEISGPPQSGKSTFSYQTMGMYQKLYKNGVSIILDMESSSDNERLRVLGVDPSKVLRLPATTMENAFANLFGILGKLCTKVESIPDLSAFIMYDTISTGGTNKQSVAASEGHSVMNAGGMQEAPRILKQNLANVFPYLEKLPIYLGLLNQVFTQMGAYAATIGSGGGYGRAVAA
jgi:RecA/RadA recombinase